MGCKWIALMKTKTQNYTVTGGTATASSYSTYTYDTNLFKVTQKNYDSTDAQQLLDWSASCAANTASTCYSVVSYTYKD